MRLERFLQVDAHSIMPSCGASRPSLCLWNRSRVQEGTEGRETGDRSKGQSRKAPRAGSQPERSEESHLTEDSWALLPSFTALEQLLKETAGRGRGSGSGSRRSPEAFRGGKLRLKAFRRSQLLSTEEGRAGRRAALEPAKSSSKRRGPKATFHARAFGALSARVRSEAQKKPWLREALVETSSSRPLRARAPRSPAQGGGLWIPSKRRMERARQQSLRPKAAVLKPHDAMRGLKTGEAFRLVQSCSGASKPLVLAARARGPDSGAFFGWRAVEGVGLQAGT